MFACLGLLHCWELGSSADTGPRRELLAAIAFGIEDWTTEAALFALVVAAWVDPDCRAEVRDVVGARFLTAVEAARERPVTILGSLARLAGITPGLSAELLALAGDVLDDSPPDVAGRSESRQPVRRPSRRSRLLRRP